MKYRRGDIVKFNVPIVKGSSTQGGYRPWLIVQNNAGNRRSSSTIVVPLTTSKTHEHMPTHAKVTGKGLIPSIAKCEQVRVVDVRQDWEYVCRVSRKTMKRVDRALMNAFFYGEDKDGE